MPRHSDLLYLTVSYFAARRSSTGLLIFEAQKFVCAAPAVVQYTSKFQDGYNDTRSPCFNAVLELTGNAPQNAEMAHDLFLVL